MRAIKLDKNKVIVFMGSMNALPMMYALELRSRGYEVVYLVDVPKKDTLSRPENHYPSISYPYPDWIIEWTIPLQIMILLSPQVFYRLLKRLFEKRISKEIGCFVLNGFFISLSPYLVKTDTVALSHGSDLDVWANSENIEELAYGIFKTGLLNKIPKTIQRKILTNFIKKQKNGFMHVDVLISFPRKFNSTGDRIIAELADAGVRYVPRYDVSFSPLTGQTRAFRENNSRKLSIFSGVRFLYENFPRGNRGYNKGNDIIIKGLARYYKENREIQIHFVKKGTDLLQAKKLCSSLGLDSAITWHPEMTLLELLNLYQQSDICFDQVGKHWMGAVGAYALWLGKPLITNDRPAVESGVWPEDNPICSAENSDEIYEWLCKLEDIEFRRRVSESSKVFVEKYMNINNILNSVFEI